MGKLRIHCGDCGETWEIESRDDGNYQDDLRTCPGCGESIDFGTWEKVINAFDGITEASDELAFDHESLHQTLFTIDYVGGNDGSFAD